MCAPLHQPLYCRPCRAPSERHPPPPGHVRAWWVLRLCAGSSGQGGAGAHHAAERQHGRGVACGQRGTANTAAQGHTRDPLARTWRSTPSLPSHLGPRRLSPRVSRGALLQLSTRPMLPAGAARPPVREPLEWGDGPGTGCGCGAGCGGLAAVLVPTGCGVRWRHSGSGHSHLAASSSHDASSTGTCTAGRSAWLATCMRLPAGNPPALPPPAPAPAPAKGLATKPLPQAPPAAAPVGAAGPAARGAPAAGARGESALSQLSRSARGGCAATGGAGGCSPAAVAAGGAGPCAEPRPPSRSPSSPPRANGLRPPGAAMVADGALQPLPQIRAHEVTSRRARMLVVHLHVCWGSGFGCMHPGSVPLWLWFNRRCCGLPGTIK